MYVNYFIYIYLEVNIYIQSTRIALPLLTFAHSCVASTSNPTRFLTHFGLLPCFPQLQRPIRHVFLLLLDFYHASRSFNVQSNTVSCSFWTSACFPAALTSNPPRFLAHFGLLPCLPQLQRPIQHGFLLLLDFCLLPRHLKVQSTTHPIHTCLPTTTSSPQRKKATPAHPCQHCLISFNSLLILLIRLFNLITIPLFLSFP